MKLYIGTYGHHRSGKMYVYWGNDNLRSGQQVVAPVTGKNGKDYNTMFTIVRALTNKNAEREEQGLTDRGIFIKTIEGRDTLSLPGAERGNFETKKAWKEDSDRRYEAETRKRLGLPPLEEENQNAEEKPREPSPHAVNPQYVKRVKEEQSQLTKSLKRLNNDNAVEKQAANERAKTALRQRQTVSNTVNQKQRLMTMRRR